MTQLADVLQAHVLDGSVTGAVALVARDADVEVAAVGATDTQTSSPMARDTIFRIASITKPITSAATMLLVDDERLSLDDPVETWLPELASPTVLRTPQSPLDDVVPLARHITVRDLLTSRAGWGFPADFSLPGVQALFTVQRFPFSPQECPPPDEWLTELSRVPMLSQPGEAWLYNTSYDVLGVLVARVCGRPFRDFLLERLFEPIGMVDTDFEVPRSKMGRFTSLYRLTPASSLELVDGPHGQWSSLPGFESGAGGLVSTVDDWLRFGRMLVEDGSVNGDELLSPASVRQMRTDHLTSGQRAQGALFLEGQSWGFGGSVDIDAVNAWNVPGRYGWVGGTGTAAHVTPSTGTTTVLLTQTALQNPAPTRLMRDFWRYAS